MNGSQSKNVGKLPPKNELIINYYTSTLWYYGTLIYYRKKLWYYGQNYGTIPSTMEFRFTKEKPW